MIETHTQTRVQVTVSTPAELAAAREARGMRQIDISQRIKLQLRQVAALEEGNWDQLPGRAFARGALRSYGKLIQADITPLLEQIAVTDATAQLPRNTLSSGIEPVTNSVYDRDSRGATWVWVIGGLVAAVGFIYYVGTGSGNLFGLGGGKPQEGAVTVEARSAPGEAGTRPVSPVAPATAESRFDVGGPAGAAAPGQAGSGPVATGPAPVEATSPAGTAPSSPPGATSSSVAAPAIPSQTASFQAGLSQTAPSSTGVMSNGGTSTAPASPSGGSTEASATSLPTPAAEAAAPVAGAGRSGIAPWPAASSENLASAIQFHAADDSWVGVADATGKRIHSALVPAGTIVTVRGKPPYRVTMGNAARMQIRYEGKDVSVPPPNEKTITRLELP